MKESIEQMSRSLTVSALPFLAFTMKVEKDTMKQNEDKLASLNEKVTNNKQLIQALTVLSQVLKTNATDLASSNLLTRPMKHLCSTTNSLRQHTSWEKRCGLLFSGLNRQDNLLSKLKEVVTNPPKICSKLQVCVPILRRTLTLNKGTIY